ncbi:MAG: hypothetical protein JKX98_03305 [Alcanivoracaceae bacterium]|nr:hypothetical protein [Alcanivoracaceae bacterium]
MLGQFPELEIDKARFERLRASRSVLSHALAIEEKYEIVINNYYDLEREITNASIPELVRNNIKNKNFSDFRLVLNIRLVNFLSSVGLYSGQLSSHIYACNSGNNNIINEIKQLFTVEYNSSFMCRFMEALKIYIQNSGIPIHRISSSKKWVDLNDECVEYSLYFGAQKSELQFNGWFNKCVLREMPDEVNLRSSSRSYIEAISRIHKHAMKKIALTIKSSVREIEMAICDYLLVSKNKPMGLCAYEYQGKQKLREVLILTKSDLRLKLIKKIMSL